jgi:acetylornithine deacetylase/succinyl-diaminopimelate desuccinylase-like protein
VRFLQNRFIESDLINVSTDEAGNGSGLLEGEEGERNILVSAHVDTLHDATVDHTVTVERDRVSGVGIADNSLGVAVVATLPAILQRLDIRLKSNLLLMGCTRSLGRGDIGGLRFFMENATLPIHSAVCVEGIHLGRLSYSCLGMLRGEITCTVPQGSEWQTKGGGAISALNRVIGRMLGIRLPQEPRTSIILGSVSAGKGYNHPPLSATLRFEVRSEQLGMVGELLREIESIIQEVNAESGVQAALQTLARRKPGGIGFNHPLVGCTRRIMQHIGVPPRIAPSVGDLSAVIAAEVPGITLGLTHGQNRDAGPDVIEIEPLFAGIAHLVAVLQAIDGGFTDDEA